MRRKRRLKAVAIGIIGLALAYLMLAYLAMPAFWSEHERHLTDTISSFVTTTPQGIPGDPINVGLVGTKQEVLAAFAKADWHPADSITWRSSVDIGLSVVFDRPYDDAPVSTLIYEGRRQDLAFERPAGTSADTRHHVRFWQTTVTDEGRPLWLGSASFDRGVGVSHDTGQITHHIGPDVDAERDSLMQTLSASIASSDEVKGMGVTKNGRNGGGDPYFTDGMVLVGTLRGPGGAAGE